MTLENQLYNDVFMYGPVNHSNVPLTPISKMLASLDGIHSGVPTRTTATLTPTTLRNIEQTFFELTNDPPATVPCQAGFVPPLPSFNFEQDHTEHSLGSTGSNSNSSWQTPPSQADEDDIAATNPNSAVGETAGSAASAKATQSSKRGMGGRRPKNPANITPEEEAKRKLRRERNKLAAARCRKRRVDQTNELIEKVEQLERDRHKLQGEIQELQVLKEDLDMCLESHRAQCRLLNNNGRRSPVDLKPPLVAAIVTDKIKSEPIDSTYDGPPLPKKILLTNANPIITAVTSTISPILTNQTNHQLAKPNRPNSLNVPLTITPSQALGITTSKNIADIAGVSITTPSTGVMFNFDSLMDGGTGLTPVSQPLMPNCSSQNKNPLDLATPTTDPSKLVSL